MNVIMRALEIVLLILFREGVNKGYLLLLYICVIFLLSIFKLRNDFPRV